MVHYSYLWRDLLEIGKSVVLGNVINKMKGITTRFIAIFGGSAIGLFIGYLSSSEYIEYVRRTAASDEDMTQAAFLCIIFIFPVTSIFGGVIGNLLWKRVNMMKRGKSQ